MVTTTRFPPPGSLRRRDPPPGVARRGRLSGGALVPFQGTFRSGQAYAALEGAERGAQRALGLVERGGDVLDGLREVVVAGRADPIRELAQLRGDGPELGGRGRHAASVAGGLPLPDRATRPVPSLRAAPPGPAWS